MRKNLLILIIIFTCFNALAQSPTKGPTSQKKPSSTSPQKNTKSTTTNNKQVTTNKKVTILTPTAQKQNNVSDLLSLLIGSDIFIKNWDKGAGITGTFQMYRDYEALDNKTSLIEYKVKTDTSATVILKNGLNHTVNKLDIYFDSVHVKRIEEFTLVDSPESKYDRDLVTHSWKQKLANIYFISYEGNKIATIKMAENGWVDYAHNFTNFNLVYEDKNLKAIEAKNGDATQSAYTAFYNGKSRPDSVHIYSFSSGERVGLYSKHVYSFAEKEKMLKEAYLQDIVYTNQTTSWEGSRLSSFETRSKNYSQKLFSSSVETFQYDDKGHRVSSKLYSVKDFPKEISTEKLIEQFTPTISQNFHNSDGQVIKQVKTLSDGYSDKEYTIDYSIDEFGFMTESKVLTKVISKSR